MANKKVKSMSEGQKATGKHQLPTRTSFVYEEKHKIRLGAKRHQPNPDIAVPSRADYRKKRSEVLVRVAVKHLDSADDIGRLEQVPAGIRLFRAGAHRHRVHTVLGQVGFLECAEHICKVQSLACLLGMH